MAGWRKKDLSVTEKDVRNLLNAEITGANKLGIWLSVNGAPYFVAYEKTQWLRDPAVLRMLNVSLNNGFQLSWDSLDLNLNLDTL